MTVPDARPSGGWIRARLPSVLWLTMVWVLLWGTFTPLSLVGGVLVAVLVMALFRQPPASGRLPVRPLRLLGLVAYLAWDLVASAVDVSWQVLRHGPRARGAIVRVPLLTESDRVVMVMANALSLTPGMMALHIDHDHGVWYVYVLGPTDAAGVERARNRTLAMQRQGPLRRGPAGPGGAAVMTVVFVVVLVMLCAAAGLTLVRLYRGPDTLDRIAALEVFVVLIVAGAAVYVAIFEDGSNVPLLAAVALLGFVGSATAARLAERGERHR